MFLRSNLTVIETYSSVAGSQFYVTSNSAEALNWLERHWISCKLGNFCYSLILEQFSLYINSSYAFRKNLLPVNRLKLRLVKDAFDTSCNIFTKRNSGGMKSELEMNKNDWSKIYRMFLLSILSNRYFKIGK